MKGVPMASLIEKRQKVCVCVCVCVRERVLEYMEWGSLGRASPLFGRTQRDLTAGTWNC